MRYLSLILLTLFLSMSIINLTAAPANARQDDQDAEALFEAVRNSEIDLVKKLLKAGVNVDAKTEYGSTALFFACDRGNKEMVELLLKAGAKPNIKDTFYKATPVTWASQNSHNEIVVMLLKAGGDGADAFLTSAFSNNSVDFAKQLIEAEVASEAALIKAKSIATRKESKELLALLKDMDIPDPEEAYVPPKKELEILTGEYQADNFNANVKLDGKELKINFAQGGDMTLEPVKQYEFAAGNGKFTFEVKDNKPVKLTMNFGAGDSVLTPAKKGAATTPKKEKPPEPKTESTDSTFEPSSAESLAADLAASSSNWPSFRGSGARGVAEGQNPPLAWNIQDNKNILWKKPIPGLGLSCPVIWDDRLFITTAVSEDTDAELKIGQYGSVESVEDDSEYEFQVICLNKNNGEIEWQTTAHTGKPAVKRHAKSSHANPTVATNGKFVVAFFGSEGIYCYNMTGELQWKKDLGLLDSGWFYDPGYQWGFGSSPIIHNNHVIIQCDIQKNSFLAAYDLTSGDEVWKTSRKEIPSWSSPTIHKFGDTTMVLTHGTKAARGYDADTGQLLWNLPGHSEIVVPTPFVAHDMIYVASGYRPIQPIYAIKPTARGDIKPQGDATTNEHIAWSVQRGGPYMPSPVVYGDYLYCCSNGGIVTCYRATTGQQVYKKRLKSKERGTMSFVSSPLAGDGHLYMTAEDGRTYVVKAGPEFKQVNENQIGENTLATPAISDGAMFFRTQNSVIAVGSQSSSSK